jgi:hypothetical protein
VFLIVSVLTRFDSLNALTSTKQEELKNLINNAIETNRVSILESARSFEFVDIELVASNNRISGSSSNLENEMLNYSLVSNSNEETSSNDSECKCLNESNLTITSNSTPTSKFITLKYARDYKKCTNQIQELVLSKINNVIAQKLTESVEILKENYLGTLKRCLKTLEEMNTINNSTSNEQNSASVSDALQQVYFDLSNKINYF